MRIKVSNYRNILSGELELQDNKLNFIVGPCGSGKSAFIDAVSKPLENTDITVNHSADDVKISVDGKDPQECSIKAFTSVQQGVMFEEAPNANGYRIFVGDDIKLQEQIEKFENQLISFSNIKDNLLRFIGQVTVLEKAFTKPNAKNLFTQKAKINQLADAVKQSSPVVQEILHKGGVDFLNWKVTGIKFLTEDDATCPFCSHKIEDVLLNSLHSLRDVESKPFIPLFDDNVRVQLSNLSIDVPSCNNSEQIESLKTKLIEIHKATEEIQTLIEFQNSFTDYNSLREITELPKISNETYNFIPELKATYEALQSNLNEINKTRGVMKSNFRNILSTNKDILNSQLKELGIPYKFEVSNASSEDHTASYILNHIENIESVDMRKSLSYGEKNLVSLLLFLHNEESNIILIDDPASSYDDFRRSQIFSCIDSCQKKKLHKTILVASHDYAFVRRAVMRKERDNESSNIGSIFFINNQSNKISPIEIKYNDFVNLSVEIPRHIRLSKTLYQKVINLRLYYDIHRLENPNAWHFTSMLLHNESKESIEEQLGKMGTSLSGILENINQELDLDIDETLINCDHKITEDFSEFEILIHSREELNNSKSHKHVEGSIKNALNDLVHMNDCMLFTLNPYKFPVWNCSLKQYIKTLD